MYLYRVFGTKLHQPRAFALCKGKITCGRCTFTLVSGVKAHLPKPLFWKPSFAALGLRTRRPCTGAKIPKIGKRGFRGPKTPISQCVRKGRFESKNPHFSTGLHKENGDLLTQIALFWRIGKWEFLDPETLFSRFWGFWPLCRADAFATLGGRACRAWKAGLGSQSSKGSAEMFSTGGFIYCVKHFAEPSCRTPKVPQNSGEPLGARTRLLRTGLLSFHHSMGVSTDRIYLFKKSGAQLNEVHVCAFEVRLWAFKVRIWASRVQTFLYEFALLRGSGTVEPETRAYLRTLT